MLEVQPRALELCTALASCSESPLRAPFGRIDGKVATPSASIAAPQRVIASNFFKVVLANVDILATNARTLAASIRRLREALKSCSQRHLIYSMPRNYWASQPRRKLDHPNRSCRRLHGLGVAHRCTQSQECFMRVLQARPNAS